MRQTVTKSRNSPKMPLSLIVMATLSIGACASDPSGGNPNIFKDMGAMFSANPGLAPEQKALRQQERDYAKARLTGTATGAAAGALTGAVIQALRGGSGKDIVAGAGIGAVGGGAIGYVGSTYLTRDHQTFVATRETLEQDITAAQEETRKMQRNVEISEAALVAQRTKIDALNAEYRDKRVSEADFRRQAQTAAEDVQTVRKMIGESDRRRAELEQNLNAYQRAGLPAHEMKSELDRQKAQADALRRVEESMLSVIDRTPTNMRPMV